MGCNHCRVAGKAQKPLWEFPHKLLCSNSVPIRVATQQEVPNACTGLQEDIARLARGCKVSCLQPPDATDLYTVHRRLWTWMGMLLQERSALECIRHRLLSPWEERCANNRKIAHSDHFPIQEI